jgi:hypothetical protein
MGPSRHWILIHALMRGDREAIPLWQKQHDLTQTLVLYPSGEAKYCYLSGANESFGSHTHDIGHHNFRLALVVSFVASVV